MKIFNVTYLFKNDIFKSKLTANSAEDMILQLQDKKDGQILIQKISYANVPTKRNEYGEFVVQIYTNGKRIKGAEYYASDIDDAIATADHMIGNY